MKVIHLNKKVPLQEVTVSFFVRQNLNHDRVLQFAELMESGVVFPPLIIDESGNIVDGRHRYEAMSLLGWTECACNVHSFDDEIEKISLAVESNMGGALPPSSADFLHVVKYLLDRRVPQNRFPDILKLPPSICKKMIDSVRKKERDVRMNKAIRAVTEDEITIPRAAETYGVNVADLKKRMGGGKGKKKAGSFSEFSESFESFNRSTGQKMQAFLKRLKEHVSDGDISHADAKKIISRVKTNARNWSRYISDYENRIDQDNGE